MSDPYITIHVKYLILAIAGGFAIGLLMTLMFKDMN